MRIALVVLLAIATALVPFGLATRDLLDIEMRPAGGAPAARIGSAGSGTGLPRQRFRSPSDGLEQIDVAIAGIGPETRPVQLTLYDGDEVLRSARGRPGTIRDQNYSFTSFAFDPVEDSGGRVFTFELALVQSGARTSETSLSPRIRSRRMQGVAGTRSGSSPCPKVLRGQITPDWDDLTGISVFARAIMPGPLRFALYRPGSQEPLRVVERTITDSFRDGSFLITFDAVPDSRGEILEWRLALPAGSNLWVQPLVLQDGTEVVTAIPSQYHGPLREDQTLLGATGLGWPDGEADMIFCTVATGRSAVADLWERMGLQLVWAGALWIGAVLALCAAVRAAAQRERIPNDGSAT